MKLVWIVVTALAAMASSPGRAEAACSSPSTDQTIQLPGRPFAAEPSADNCRLYVSLVEGRNAGAVVVLANDNGAFHIAREVKVTGGSGGGAVLSHNGSLLAVAAEQSVILLDVGKLNTPNQQPVVAQLPEGSRGAIYVRFSQDDARLFVSEERSASIAVIDVAAAIGGKGDKAITGRIPVGQAPVGLALSPDGTRLFATSEIMGKSDDCKPEKTGGHPHAQGALFIIDTAKAATDPRHAVAGAIKAGCNPVRVATSPDGRTLWISQRGDGRVAGLDAAALLSGDKTSTTSIAVGASPVGLALRPDGAQLWVANSDRFAAGDSSLALVDSATPAAAKVIDRIGVGAFPRDLRFLPDGRTLVVALFGARSVLLHPTVPATKR